MAIRKPAAHPTPTSISKFVPWVLPSILFLSFFWLYFQTMPRALTGYQDSDLFLALAKTGGLPPPSGYPLYLLLLTAFTRLPLPLDFISSAHTFSVLLTSLSVVLVYLSGVTGLRSKSSYPKADPVLVYLAAAAGAIFFGLNYYLWLYGQIADKYSLSVLLTVLLGFLLLRLLNQVPKISWWLPSAIALTAGLGWSHHYSLWLTLPAVLYALYYSIKSRSRLTPWIPALVILILAVLLPPLGLIFLSRSTPLSWNPGAYPLGWLAYFSRSEFFQNLFLSNLAPIILKPLDLNGLTNHLLSFAKLLLISFGPFLWLIFPASIYSGYRRSSPVFWLLLLLFSGLGLGSAAYLGWPADWINQVDVLPQFLPALTALALLCQLGWYLVISRFFRFFQILFSAKIAWIVVGFFFTALTLLALWFRFPKVDMYFASQVHTRYRKILSSVPDHTVLVCFSKFSCHALLYFQSSENLRPDVTLVPATLNLLAQNAVETDLNTFYYPDNPMALIDLITTNLDKRPVMVVDLNDYYYNLLGLTTPFMYYLPLGAYGQLTRSLPETLPQYPISFSDPFTTLKTSPHDPMRLLLKTQPARDHLLNASTLIRLDARSRALPELNQAANLYYSLTESEKRQIDAYRQTIEQTNPDPDFVPGAKVFSVDQLLSYLPALYQGNFVSRAYQTAFGAVMVDPVSVPARLAFAEALEKINRLPEALVEYRHVLRLESTNASAAAAIDRLSSFSL